MIDVAEKKRKIISFLEKEGPSLPVRIAKTIEMDPVFASAILSELLGNKSVIMSNMKIGSSSLYFLPGQEERLTEYVENLKSKELEAFQKLQKEKVLEDDDEEPAIRIALRGLKDFAIPEKKEEKIIWKYKFAKIESIPQKEPEVKEEKVIEEEKEKEEKVDEEKEELVKEKEIKEVEKERGGKQEEKKEHKKLENIFQNKGEFLDEVKKFLAKNKIDLLEEIKTEKKEVVAIVNIPSNVGPLNFILIAKNKMATNKEEISSAMQLSSYHKMPCLFLIKKEPTGAIKKILEENNLIKIDIIS